MKAPRLSLLTLGLVTVLVAAASATTGRAFSFDSDAEAASTCQGFAATIVGTPDTRLLKGSADADVIVTDGAYRVSAKAGDDIVCVTGPTRFVEAASGDDVVATARGRVETATNLGAGADKFIGGNRPDRIVQGWRAGPEVDEIGTGGGPDTYLEELNGPNDAGGAPTPSNELIDLGPGDDRAFVGAPNLAGSLDGGSGLNWLSLYNSPAETFLPWVLDNETGVATLDGVARYHWSNFREFTAPFGPVTFHGSSVAEVIRATGGQEYQPFIELLDMRGGDDRVVLFSILAPVTGGQGEDSLRLLGFRDPRTGIMRKKISIDLKLGALHADEGTRDLVNVESVEVDGFFTVDLQGNAEPNRFVVGKSCHVRMNGSGGPDTLFARPDHGCGPGRAQSLGIPRGIYAYGDGGTDHLNGRGTDDLLVGGSGRDTVDGQGGTDSCSAEIERHCEPAATG